MENVTIEVNSGKSAQEVSMENVTIEVNSGKSAQ
jgi:hypothetical protein